MWVYYRETIKPPYFLSLSPPLRILCKKTPTISPFIVIITPLQTVDRIDHSGVLADTEKAQVLLLSEIGGPVVPEDESVGIIAKLLSRLKIVLVYDFITLAEPILLPIESCCIFRVFIIC